MERYRNRWALPSDRLRAVWAMVTTTPAIHGRVIAKRLRISHTAAHRALHALRDTGYIDFADRSQHARTVIVPFIAVKKEKR